MNFAPYPNRAGLILLGIAALGAIAVALLIQALLQAQSPAALFKLLVALLLILALTGVAFYGTLVAFSLDYHLSRNGLTIHWGLSRQLVPIHLIEKIIPGNEIMAAPKFRGLTIGGLRFGWATLADYGPLKFRTTAPLDQSLLVITPAHTYVISPQQPDAFIRAWQARQPLGATQQWSHQVYRRWPLNLPLFLDPWTWGLLGLASLICFALFGYLATEYARLPQSIPIHFDSIGQADRIANKSEVFIFPLAGALVLSFNMLFGGLIYRREKIAAYLLWGTATAMQLYLWLAVLAITHL
jgi:hypothetical protein